MASGHDRNCAVDQRGWEMASVTDKKTYTRADVALHKEPDDLWIILHGRVYNVTKWAETHPGGKQVLRNYGGEDASVSVCLCLCVC